MYAFSRNGCPNSPDCTLDSATGLTKFGARYYDPTTARFTQQDPSGREANAYAYVGGNPVNFVDPSGLVDVDCGFFEAGCSFKLSDSETRDLLIALGAGAALSSKFPNLPARVISSLLAVDFAIVAAELNHGRCASVHIGLDLVTQGSYECSDYGD